MDLSRTVSEIDGDFSRKLHNFPNHRVLCPSRCPWNWVSAQGSEKNRNDGATKWSKKL